MSNLENILPPKWLHEEAIAEITLPSVRYRLGSDALDFAFRVAKKGYESLIFLDRSARPAAWLYKDIARRVLPHKKLPAIHFVNIGREKEYDLDIGSLPSDLRRTFGIGTGEKDQSGGRILTDNTYFDFRKICLVDEHSPTGQSLRLAKRLFQEAFTGRYLGDVNTEVVFMGEPPWYDVGYNQPDEWRKEQLLGISTGIDDTRVQVYRYPSLTNRWFRSMIALAAEEASAK